MTKWFKSPRKLNSLPVGALVTFSEDAVYGAKWRKVQDREGSGFWAKVGDTYTGLHPFSSRSMLAYEDNREFQVVAW